MVDTMVDAVVGTMVVTMVDAVTDSIFYAIVEKLPSARTVSTQNTKRATIYVPTQQGATAMRPDDLQSLTGCVQYVAFTRCAKLLG